MKASEIREMSVEELELKLADLKEELFNLRFQLAVNQLENSSRIGAERKTSQEFLQFFVCVNSMALRLKRGGLNSE